MSKKTILFTESGTFGGGSFLSLLQLLGQLDRDSYEPLVAFVNDTPVYKKVQALGIKTFLLTDPIYSLTVPRRVRKHLEHLEEGTFKRLPCFSGLVHRICHRPLITGLVRIIHEHKVDLLYMNDQIDRDFFGLEVARRTNIPVVSHLRSMNGEPFTLGKAEAANKAVHVFVSRAEVVKDYWVKRGLDPAKIEVVPNGLELRPVTPMDVRAEFGLAPEQRIIGCVGRIIPEKGHMFLVDGFARLRHNRADVSLLILGDGPYMKQVQARVDELGVPDVIFAGRCSNAQRLMTGMDCMVQASSSDSFGRTVIEAMMAGSPVVAADTGGIREILNHGENGLLVPYGDVDGLAKVFSELLTDHQLAKRIAEAGSVTVSQDYDLTKMTRTICAIIDRAINTA